MEIKKIAGFFESFVDLGSIFMNFVSNLKLNRVSEQLDNKDNKQTPASSKKEDGTEKPKSLKNSFFTRNDEIAFSTLTDSGRLNAQEETIINLWLEWLRINHPFKEDIFCVHFATEALENREVAEGKIWKLAHVGLDLPANTSDDDRFEAMFKFAESKGYTTTNFSKNLAALKNTGANYVKEFESYLLTPSSNTEPSPMEKARAINTRLKGVNAANPRRGRDRFLR